MKIKQIENYPDYFISEIGTVFYKDKEIKPFVHVSVANRKYHVVIIEHKRMQVHRLVAYAFLPKPKYKNQVVLHMDKNTLNNTYTNLYFVRRRNLKLNKENAKKGTKHHNSKLNESDIKKIRELAKKDYSHKHIAMIINKCGKRNITEIVNGKTWAHIKP